MPSVGAHHPVVRVDADPAASADATGGANPRAAASRGPADVHLDLRLVRHLEPVDQPSREKVVLEPREGDFLDLRGRVGQARDAGDDGRERAELDDLPPHGSQRRGGF